MRYRLLLSALVVLLLVQSGVLMRRVTARPTLPAPPRELTVGDTVARVSGLDAGGRPVTLDLASGAAPYTVVLAYDAGCAHSAKVAAEWKAWLAHAPARARVIGLAKDPPDSAVAYRAAHAWKMDVVAVARPAFNSTEYVLLRRTPWLWVFDSRGVLRMEAHGSSLAAVDSLLAGAAD